MSTVANAVANAPFAGLDCSSGTPKPQTPAAAAQNLNKLLQSFGASQNCQQAIASKVAEHSTSGGFSGNAQMGFGFLGSMSMGGNFQTSGSEVDHYLQQNGCGNLLVNSKTVMDSLTNMHCTLNQTSSTSSIATSANASVTIKIERSKEFVDTIMQKNDVTQQRMVQVIANLSALPANSAALPFTQSLLDSLQKQYNANLQLLDASINITGSNITVQANTRVKQINSNTSQVTASVTQDYNNVVSATAQQTMSQNGGFDATTGAIKSLIQSEVQNQQQNINSEIHQVLTSTSLNVLNASSIVITSPQAITLTNTTLSATAAIDIASSSLTASAMSTGVQLAQKLMATMDTTQLVTQTNAGMEGVVAANNAAIGTAIGSQMGALTSMTQANSLGTQFSSMAAPMYAMAAVGGVAIIGFVIFKSMTSSSEKQAPAEE